MKKLVLITVLFITVSLQANNIRIIEMSQVKARLSKNEAPQKVMDAIEPGDWCKWHAGVYVSHNHYDSQAEENSAWQAYFIACMKYGGDHAE